MPITLDLKPAVEARLQSEASAKGISLTELVETVVEEHALLDTVPPEKQGEMKQRLMQLAEKWHEMPTLDSRDADSIVGYDDYGLSSRRSWIPPH